MLFVTVLAHITSAMEELTLGNMTFKTYDLGGHEIGLYYF